MVIKKKLIHMLTFYKKCYRILIVYGVVYCLYTSFFMLIQYIAVHGSEMKWMKRCKHCPIELVL